MTMMMMRLKRQRFLIHLVGLRMWWERVIIKTRCRRLQGLYLLVRCCFCHVFWPSWSTALIISSWIDRSILWFLLDFIFLVWECSPNSIKQTVLVLIGWEHHQRFDDIYLFWPKWEKALHVLGLESEYKMYSSN